MEMAVKYTSMGGIHTAVHATSDEAAKGNLLHAQLQPALELQDHAGPSRPFSSAERPASVSGAQNGIEAAYTQEPAMEVGSATSRRRGLFQRT